MIREYYVYIHYDRNGHIIYCGKGKELRAWSTLSRNSDWWNKVLIDNTVQFEVEIIYQCLSNDDALKLEKKYIKEYGLDNLTNRIN